MPENAVVVGSERPWFRRVSSCVARSMLLSAVLALATLSTRADAMGNERSPGKIENGAIVPTRPVAKQYGPDPQFTCPRGGVVDIFKDELDKIAKSASKPPPEVDGRLCAMADTLLGWKDPNPPPASVLEVLARDFGLVTPPARAFVATLETEDQQQIGEKLAESVKPYVQRADGVRYALVPQRAGRGSTKIVLLIGPPPRVEVEGVPRSVPAGGTVSLSVKPAPAVSGLKVLACDPQGKLTTVDGLGPTGKVELACGARPGVMFVEIRGAVEGATSSLASFQVGCGADLPTAAPIPPPPPKGTPDVAAEARKVLDGVNAIRAAADRPPLAWDDAVAAVARDDADSLRASNEGGAATRVDILARLKENGIGSLSVLQNPAAARSVGEAAALVASSPVSRANLLDPRPNHAGIGLSVANRADGAVFYMSQLLVQELAPPDVAALDAKLREAIARRRSDARATPLHDDPVLEKVAKDYAAALAASGGSVPKEKESAILAPLYKGYRTVNVMSGVKADPLEFAEESGIVSPANLMGLGLAAGTSASLGKNSAFVVIITASKQAPAGAHAADGKASTPAATPTKKKAKP